MTKVEFTKSLLTNKELDYLAQAAKSGSLSGDGPFTKKAEHLITERLGLTSGALLTTSCTHALEMAAILLDLEPGDEVIVPSFTFVSSALAFAMHGAKVVFCDVDDETLSAGPAQVAPYISERTKAVCVVHYGGVANDPQGLKDLCAEHNIALIEDNAHGLFARHEGQPLGTFGTFATQSFHGTKNITSGEGGALIVNDPVLHKRAEIIREKGTDRSKFLRGEVDKYTWVDKGSSYVMSDLLAAILVGQLERFDEIQNRRRATYFRYHRELADWASTNGVRIPSIENQSRTDHPAHVFYLRFPSPEFQQKFISYLREQDVVATFHYQPLHLSKMGADLGGVPGDHPVTEEAAACLVRLPLFEAMTEADQAKVIEAVKSFECNLVTGHLSREKPDEL